MLKTFEAITEDGFIRLPADVPAAAHCVVTILNEDIETLRKQSEFVLSEQDQLRMNELLVKNREATLTPQESQELDTLSAEFDAATLTKGSALAALVRFGGNAQRD